MIAGFAEALSPDTWLKGSAQGFRRRGGPGVRDTWTVTGRGPEPTLRLPLAVLSLMLLLVNVLALSQTGLFLCHTSHIGTSERPARPTPRASESATTAAVRAHAACATRRSRSTAATDAAAAAISPSGPSRLGRRRPGGPRGGGRGRLGCSASQLPRRPPNHSPLRLRTRHAPPHALCRRRKPLCRRRSSSSDDRSCGGVGQGYSNRRFCGGGGGGGPMRLSNAMHPAPARPSSRRRRLREPAARWRRPPTKAPPAQLHSASRVRRRRRRRQVRALPRDGRGRASSRAERRRRVCVRARRRGLRGGGWRGQQRPEAAHEHAAARGAALQHAECHSPRNGSRSPARFTSTLSPGSPATERSCDGSHPCLPRWDSVV